MTLEVVTQPNAPLALDVQFVVPGHQRWTLRSVRANVHRAVGGTPNRAYQLTISDGTSVVAASGAQDIGTEPGTGSVTWCDCSPGAVSAGSDMVVVAPLPQLVLDAGYVITLTILNPAAGDTWLDSLVWTDYVLTTP